MVKENIEKKNEDIEEKENKEDFDDTNNLDIKKNDELINNLEERVKFLEKELKNEIETRDKWITAEKINTRREMNAEISSIINEGNKRMIKWIVNFFIDLEERFLKFFEEDYKNDEKMKHHIDAMKIIKDNLWNNLKKEGVERIELKVNSDIWDSKFHESVGSILKKDIPEYTIVEVIENGFLYNNWVIRPSKVIISRKDDNNNE